MSDLAKFDSWLDNDGPAALVSREHLMPVEGNDGVVFPATFAAAEDKSKFPGGYNIDGPADGRNICLIDSVGSQANRIEPLFALAEYAGLVPQIIVTAGTKQINLLEAGHRAGDALVRCSSLKADLQAGFKEAMKGNAEPLAKIAPTSLVFGVWDSRDTQAKLPRLIASTIRAFNVRKLTRSAQYVPATEYVAAGLLPEPEGKQRDAYSERGFIHVPASGSHGGIIAEGGIRRDTTLSLGALRLLAMREGNTLSTDRTRALRRYILGLALVSFTYRQPCYLRQGCNLVPDPDKPAEITLVHADGRREAISIKHEEAKVYALAAAKAFVIGASQTVPFDQDRARKDVTGETEKMKGTVTALGKDAASFTLDIGKPKKPQPITITTNDTTQFLKGKELSTFEGVVASGAKLEVEMVNDMAAKVILKK